MITTAITLRIISKVGSIKAIKKPSLINLSKFSEKPA